MRQIEQPGMPPVERIQWVEARGRAFTFTLEAGLPLIEAVRRGFAEAGFASGTLNFEGGALGPLAYVMPALSADPQYAAFYSETFRPAGVTQLKYAAMTLGQRDGSLFFHCHALWREADGWESGGHILPDTSIVAEPVTVRAFGLDGAVFTAEPDLETNFTLFGPLPSLSREANADARVFALRLRPNQDFAGALEGFCRARGITRARLHGGVGSIIGAHFADGRIVEPYATELLLRSGSIEANAAGELEAALDVALVDYTGALAQGRLVRGDNPVLMTMEVALEVT